jgi:hypothetical protein
VRGVGEQRRERIVELGDVARLDEAPRVPVDDDLCEPADPARDDGRGGRHRLDRGQPEQLRHRVRPAVAGDVHRRVQASTAAER